MLCKDPSIFRSSRIQKFVQCEAQVMPLCHLVDQHTYRGIAHVLGEGAESTFALRFQSLFSKCTGFNPRLADPDS